MCVVFADVGKLFGTFIEGVFFLPQKTFFNFILRPDWFTARGDRSFLARQKKGSAILKNEYKLV